MGVSVAWGSVCFGLVIGWITYYTMRKNTKPRALADITVIISALVGPAIIAVFPAPVEGTNQTMFGFYGIGLALGFFLYYVIFVLLLWKAPRKLLLSMGLVQRRSRKPGADSGSTVTQPADPGIMGAHGDSPFGDDE
jgi:uncharacterized membrane protein YeaQ/YmgE (transglycosylase-associated protein family)